MIFLEDTLSVMRSVHKSKGNEAIYTFDDLLGENPQFVKAKTLARKVAGFRSSVLIQGESGTGKELFAQAIHNASMRGNEPFVALNCSAIPADLIESELFGYEPGAFTGALKSGKIGKLELASGGTLFLDEVESMPLNVQIKLLRVLSSQKISKIGGSEDVGIDVRVISATKLDLLKEADRGNFREDLYYRISIIAITLPSLRERTDDIPLLVGHFIGKYAREFYLPEVKVSDEFLRALTFYSWRGNVRELSNVLERAVVLYGGGVELSLEHLPDRLQRSYQFKELESAIASRQEEDEKLQSPGQALKMAEEIAIKSVLKRVNGNMTRASKVLGVSKPTLYSKINQNPNLRSMRKPG
jgi:transcriptional regulator with PAS, ATPase and Fis domain